MGRQVSLVQCHRVSVSQPSPYKSLSILNGLSTSIQPPGRYHCSWGKVTWGMSWGGHVVAQHKGSLYWGTARVLISLPLSYKRKAGKQFQSCFPAFLLFRVACG